jgi:osmotically-inducible protein OsmY
MSYNDDRRRGRYRVYDEDQDQGRQGRVTGQGYGNYDRGMADRGMGQGHGGERGEDRRGYGTGGTVGAGSRHDRGGDYARGYYGGEYSQGAGGSFAPYGERDDDRGRRGRQSGQGYGGQGYGERGARGYTQNSGDYGYSDDRSDYGNREWGGPTYGQPTYGSSDRGRRYSGSGTGADYGGQGYSSRHDEGRDRMRGRDRGRDERGFFERAGDEISSWFGDDEAERRRRMDAERGDSGAQHHRGRGPRGYTRSDDRIREDINDRLTDDYYVDASDVEVAVSGAEVTLSGTVDSREAKRRAEDVAEAVSGVRHVQNNLRVRQQGMGGTTGGMGVMSGSGTAGMTGGMGLTGGMRDAGGSGITGTGQGGTTGTTGTTTGGMGGSGSGASTTLGGDVGSTGTGAGRTGASGRTDSF